MKQEQSAYISILHLLHPETFLSSMDWLSLDLRHKIDKNVIYVIRIKS